MLLPLHALKIRPADFMTPPSPAEPSAARIGKEPYSWHQAQKRPVTTPWAQRRGSQPSARAQGSTGRVGEWSWKMHLISVEEPTRAPHVLPWIGCMSGPEETSLWFVLVMGEGTHSEFMAQPGGGPELWISILGLFSPVWPPLRSSPNSHPGIRTPALSTVPHAAPFSPLSTGYHLLVLLTIWLPLSLPSPVSAHPNPSSPAFLRMPPGLL